MIPAGTSLREIEERGRALFGHAHGEIAPEEVLRLLLDLVGAIRARAHQWHLDLHIVERGWHETGTKRGGQNEPRD